MTPHFALSRWMVTFGLQRGEGRTHPKDDDGGLGLSKASNNIVIFRFSVIGKEDYSEKLIFSEIER